MKWALASLAIGLTTLCLSCAIKKPVPSELTKVIAIECLTGPIVERECDRDGLHCKAARIDYIPDCAVIKVGKGKP